MFINKHFIVLIIFTFTLLPLTTSAQTYNLEWRQRTSELNSKISTLDSNRVIDLPVPILFGISPSNLTRNFGDARSATRTHEGLDIMAPKGAIIISPTKAVVTRVGLGDSAGYYVYTANPGGETFVYIHLDQASHLKEGDIIEKGDLIGYVGNTGNAINAGYHLHFEIRNDAGATDPFPRLTQVLSPEEKEQYLTKIRLTFGSNISGVTPTTTIVSSYITRTLRVGSVGEDVKVLQAALGATADGSFGPKTKAVVVTFQVSRVLIADGVFGPMSRAALFTVGAPSIMKPGCTSTTLYSPLTGVKC